VHDACRNGNLPLLETLHQNGFELNSANKKGETPLHLSLETVRCTEFLLKRFLGQFCIPRDAKREEIVGRTPHEQQHAEDTLGERDAAASAFKWGCVATQVAKLLIYNLLGPLVFLKNEEVETRTELEQQQVERILGVRDADGWTALHGAMNCQEKYELLELMLINLLGTATTSMAPRNQCGELWKNSSRSPSCCCQRAIRDKLLCAAIPKVMSMAGVTRTSSC
jgi:hypothetical protein